jgi:hypothetical protein
MAARKPKGKPPPPIPPGATRKAWDRTGRPSGPPPSKLGDPRAAGTPAGGTEVGGLGGTNIDEGSPRNADLEEAMGASTAEPEADQPAEGYAGPAGGAVGGTPAGKRSSGGRTRGGIKPGGVHRGDSTIGTDPKSGTE